MQAIEVVRTIEWINLRVTAPMRSIVLGTALLHNLSSKEEGELTPDILTATHDWVKAIVVWSSNEKAVEVLEAFGLARLLDENEPVSFAGSNIGRAREPYFHKFYIEITQAFDRMTSCGRAMRELVVPPELRHQEQPEDILSITIRSDERIALKTLYLVLGHLANLYDALGELAGLTVSDLELVSIESGSPVSINVKGSGEIVRELRLLVAEVWNRLRFKKHEEQIANNNVLLSSLGVMTEIDKRSRNGSLLPETAEKLKRNITRNMLGLINCHALPTEIPEVEVVMNDKLLEAFNPKLLTADSTLSIAASQSSDSEAPAQVSANRKSTSSRKHVGKRSRKK